MEVVVKQPFYDIRCACDRSVGDVFDAAPDRVDELNRAGFGILVEAVAVEPPAQKPKAASKARKAKVQQ